ncbi:MAG: GntR family transcriptional regulator [Pigmentiphaga sp.]
MTRPVAAPVATSVFTSATLPAHAAGGSRSGRRQNLRSQVYTVVRERIHQGKIGPEARLIDVEIAAEMGVSRMPARDALLQLTHEGYLVATTRGFRLPRLEPEDVREIFEVRRLLEPRAAALAARDRSAEQLALLAEARGRAARAHAVRDAGAFIQATLEFRQVWMAAVRNRRLAETLQRFVDHVQIVRFGTLMRSAVREEVLQGLDVLYGAFAARDPVQAHDGMAHFVMRAEAVFFAAGPPPRQKAPSGSSAAA